jgi:hypothetical protein
MAGLVPCTAAALTPGGGAQVLPMLRPVLGRGRVGNFLVRNKWRNYEAIQRCRDLPLLLLSSLRARAGPSYRARGRTLQPASWHCRGRGRQGSCRLLVTVSKEFGCYDALLTRARHHW